MFPKLNKPSQFDLVFREGVRRRDANLGVAVRLNGLDRCRLGMAVPRGPGGAIRRNLVRRRLREVFRKHVAGTEPGLDVVVTLSRGGSIDYAALTDSLPRLVASARRKLAGRAGRDDRGGPS